MKRRGLIFAALAAAALGFWYWTGEQPAVRAPPPSPGDCERIELWNNGFHTDLIMPAALLPADHPLRQLDPRARYILVGWGDEAFFRSDGTDMLLGAKALLPGGAVTMHVVYADVPVEQVYLPKDVTPLAISHAGAAALAKRFAETLILDSAGHAQIIEQGHAGPRSWFLKARGEFDLFTICNQWTARALRIAGVPVNAAFVYLGDWLVALLKSAPHRCPA